MRELFPHHRGFWSRERKRALYIAIIFFGMSLIVQITLGRYSSLRSATAPYVPDIFLDNLPFVNLGFIIVTANIALWTLLWILLAYYPKKLIFGIEAIALFNIVRAFFINLTHIGPYPTAFIPGPSNFGYALYSLFTFQGNYFFSGHTGIPFLLALIFWNHKFWRRFFLGASIFFGASVLLAHVHYSIDVFAAPFITYGIYTLARKLFPRDYGISVA